MVRSLAFVTSSLFPDHIAFREDVRVKVEGYAGALYQAFRGGAAARRWWRRSSKFKRDLNVSPFDMNAFGPGSGA